VVAVEPNPETFRVLAANVELNGFKNVRLVNAALGERERPLSSGLTYLSIYLFIQQMQTEYIFGYRLMFSARLSGVPRTRNGKKRPRNHGFQSFPRGSRSWCSGWE